MRPRRRKRRRHKNSSTAKKQTGLTHSLTRYPSPISSDGNTKWGRGRTSRTLTRPPTTTTTRRRRKSERVRDRGPIKFVCTVNNIGYYTLGSISCSHPSGKVHDKASERAAIFHLCDVAVSKAHHAHPMYGGREGARISGSGFREYPSVVSLNLTTKRKADHRRLITRSTERRLRAACFLMAQTEDGAAVLH